MLTPPGRRGLAIAIASLVLAACSPASVAPSLTPPGPIPGAAPVPASVADDPSGPRYPTSVPSSARPVVRTGDDWTMPAWARPAPFSGFFSEDASPKSHVPVRSVDVTWRQIAPSKDGPLDLTATGKAEGMRFPSLGDQLAAGGPYWLRLFASGVDWAPTWVAKTCGVTGIGPDYEGEKHLPIWNDCVWSALRDTWRKLLVDQRILADPDFRFAYVPGGFTWVEFDYDIISTAVARHLLTEEAYLTWYARMLDDLAGIAGNQVGQLVFTGEDYPWGPFGAAEDLLATAAVRHGFGVRTGITEEFNFHLSETPAYGSQVQPDGHLTLTRDTGGQPRVFASENECYTDCGYHAKDLKYAVVHSNLKALQLQLNWLYVVPSDSYLARYPDHWDWVRLSLGQTAATAPDAWVALRTAQDTSWTDRPIPGRTWRSRPWVRNLERWLVQVDTPGAVAHRTKVDRHSGDPTKENGTAYEGLATKRSAGDGSLAFRVDPAFLSAEPPHPVLVKVTYRDAGRGSFQLRHADGSTPSVRLTNTRKWRTATFALDLRADHSLPGGTDLWLDTSRTDLVVRFVRVLRLEQPGR